MILEIGDSADKKHGRLIVLTGPTSAGKDTIRNRLVEGNSIYKKLVSCTTRPMREYEVDGVQYYFKSLENFNNLEQNGEVLQKSYYGGHFYAATKESFHSLVNGVNLVWIISMRSSLILENMIRGAFNDDSADKILQDHQLIFIGVENLIILKNRNRNRGDDKQTFLDRLRVEWQLWNDNKDQFQNVVINRDIDDTIRQVLQIIGS